MAVGALFAMLFPKARLLLFFLFPLSARVAFLAYVGADVFGLTQSDTGIAHAAHLGGALYGLIWYFTRVRRR